MPDKPLKLTPTQRKLLTSCAERPHMRWPELEKATNTLAALELVKTVGNSIYITEEGQKALEALK